MSRIDKVVRIRECLQSVAEQIIGQDCGGGNPLDIPRLEPFPHSVSCIKNRCAAVYEGPKTDFNSIYAKYFQKKYSNYIYPPQDELCKKLMDFADQDYIDPYELDYE